MGRAATILLLLPTGCFWAETLRPLAAASSAWHEVGPVRRPLEEITRAAHLYLVRAGYTIPDFDPAARRMETDWDVHLSSIWREGFRTKVEVEFEEVSPEETLVRIRSYREVNEDNVSPLILAKAKWVGASVDAKQASAIPEPAMRLQQQLKIRFFGLGHE